MKSASHPLSDRFMKNSRCLAPALFSMMLAAPSILHGQQSVYEMDWTSASFAGMGLNGGTVVVAYKLTSGSAVVGLGSSYNVTFTVSDLTSVGTAAGNDYVWYQPGSNQSAPGVIGTEYDIASLLTNLPANNQLTGSGLSDNAASPSINESPDGFFRANIASGNLDQLGTFTVTSSAAPVISGYSLVEDTVQYYSVFNYVSTSAHPGFIQQGVWAAPQGSVVGLPGNPSTGPLFTDHGDTATFDFTAFDNLDDPSPIFQNGRGFWNASGRVTFETVPEPSGAMLLGSAGFLILLRRRRYN